MKLSRSFFNRNPEVVARDLLGKVLVKGNLKGRIIETEAYFTTGDKASHSFSRKKAKEFFNTKKPGTAYVYLNYGMYWLLNVITKDGAVLFRALEPISGIDIMKKNRNNDDVLNLLSGPGKLTRAFKIDGDHHGIDLINNHLNIQDNEDKIDIVKSKRIGISKDKHKLLRFYIKDNNFVSNL